MLLLGMRLHKACGHQPYAHSASAFCLVCLPRHSKEGHRVTAGSEAAQDSGSMCLATPCSFSMVQLQLPPSFALMKVLPQR